MDQKTFLAVIGAVAVLVLGGYALDYFMRWLFPDDKSKKLKDWLELLGFLILIWLWILWVPSL